MMKNILAKAAVILLFSMPFVRANAAENTLDVITYNIWAFAIGGAQKISERLKAIPASLPEADVLAFQEVWEPEATSQLISDLSTKYPYVTDDVWELGKVIKSGVRIFSKWPIEEEYFQSYGACAAEDCLANKGVVYVKIMKGKTPYHIFATHTQAANSSSSISARRDQLKQFAHFVRVISPQAGEAVIFAGDFNIDKVTQYDDYQALLSALEVDDYESTGHPFTYDYLTNPWVSSNEQAIFDYVFYSEKYKKPLEVSREVFMPKDASGEDLSDHYPVLFKSKW